MGGKKNKKSLLKDFFIDSAKTVSSPCFSLPATSLTCPNSYPDVRMCSPAARWLSRSRRLRWPRPGAGGLRRSAPRPPPSAAAPARGPPPRTPVENAVLSAGHGAPSAGTASAPSLPRDPALGRPFGPDQSPSRPRRPQRPILIPSSTASRP